MAMTFQHSFHSPNNHVLVTLKPGLKDCMGRVSLTGTVPAARLAKPGDGFPGLGQHVPHSPIHAQERPSGQSVCALWPSGRCSCSGQCQELPIACSAHGGALLSGYVLQALVAGLAAHVLDWTQGCALASDEQSWPESAMWRGCVLGKTTDEAESEYIQIWKRERKRERHGNVITLYASAWYQQGHDHSSVVYGMFHMVIHLLKDLVLWAGMRLASGVHRGKNME